jgi:hypothetical protein
VPLLDFSGAPHGGSHKLLPEWNSQARIVPVLIIDHSQVGSSLGTYYYFRDQTGIESHFSVLGARSGRRDGHIWQFMNTDRMAEANLRANRFPNGTGAISIETEDNGDPDHQPWSPRQLSSLKWLHNKLARMYPTIPRRRCTAPTGSGAQGPRPPHAVRRAESMDPDTEDLPREAGTGQAVDGHPAPGVRACRGGRRAQ